MRYHYSKPKDFSSNYGQIYKCDHPVYDTCTLFKIGDFGLAVIQQRFDKHSKKSWWSSIDPWLCDDIYKSPGFEKYFQKMAGRNFSGLYPTVSVRQIMWALKMKPIERERWETLFDRKEV